MNLILTQKHAPQRGFRQDTYNLLGIILYHRLDYYHLYSKTFSLSFFHHLSHLDLELLKYLRYDALLELGLFLICKLLRRQYQLLNDVVKPIYHLSTYQVPLILITQQPLETHYYIQFELLSKLPMRNKQQYQS